MTETQFEFVVPATHAALPGHFPGRPIVPGVVLLDEVLQAIERTLQRPAATLLQVKLLAALLPDECARGTLRADGDRVGFVVEARRDGAATPLASGSLRLAGTP